MTALTHVLSSLGHALNDAVVQAALGLVIQWWLGNSTVAS